jgi:hypothetical protein
MAGDAGFAILVVVVAFCIGLGLTIYGAVELHNIDEYNSQFDPVKTQRGTFTNVTRIVNDSAGLHFTNCVDGGWDYSYCNSYTATNLYANDSALRCIKKGKCIDSSLQPGCDACENMCSGLCTRDPLNICVQVLNSAGCVDTDLFQAAMLRCPANMSTSHVTTCQGYCSNFNCYKLVCDMIAPNQICDLNIQYKFTVNDTYVVNNVTYPHGTFQRECMFNDAYCMSLPYWTTTIFYKRSSPQEFITAYSDDRDAHGRMIAGIVFLAISGLFVVILIIALIVACCENAAKRFREAELQRQTAKQEIPIPEIPESQEVTIHHA